MLLVCKQTFSWSSLRLINKIPKVDLFTIALVSTVTVTKDLAQAVFYGVVASALGFAWKQSTQDQGHVISANRGWKTYEVDGPLFFGSTSTFSNQFDPKSDPNDVIIDFKSSRVVDHSALESINELARKYGDLSKKVHLRGLSSDCYQLLERLNGEKPITSSWNPVQRTRSTRSPGTTPSTATISVPRKDAAPPADAGGVRSSRWGTKLRKRPQARASTRGVQSPERSGRAVPVRSPNRAPGRSVASICVGWLARAPPVSARRIDRAASSRPPIYTKTKKTKRKYLRGLPMHAPTSGGPQRAHGQPRSARDSFRIPCCVLLLSATTRHGATDAAPTAGQNVRPRDDHLLRHVRRTMMTNSELFWGPDHLMLPARRCLESNFDVPCHDERPFCVAAATSIAHAAHT